MAYALDGRIAAGLALVEQGVEQVVARGRARGLAPSLACLSEAYLLAGRLEEARQRAAQALDHARQHKQRGTQAWALWLLGESAARQVSPEGEPAVGHYRQTLALAEGLACAAPGALPAWPGHAVCQEWQWEQARRGPCAALDLYRDMQ